MRSAARSLRAHAALAGIIPKVYMAYGMWFWASIVLNMVAITIFVFFWRAVYAGTNEIAGLDLQQTLSYILLAQIFAPLASIQMIYEFGYNLREGGIAHVLLRPLDIQAGFLGQYFASMLTELVMQIPIALLVTVLFKMQWPRDPAVWGAFILAAILGRTILFFFDWAVACLTFYTTETWGLGVMVFGIGLFLSGSMIPLAMLPGVFRDISIMTPFAQALYIPVSILSGVTPLAEAPRLWLVQLGWLVGLLVLSRLIFKVAVRKVTVQGG